LNPCVRVSSGAKAIATFKSIRFKIMANRPKVIQVKGLVMKDRIGLRKRFINPIIALSFNNVTKSPRNVKILKYCKARTARVFKTICRRILWIHVFIIIPKKLIIAF